MKYSIKLLSILLSIGFLAACNGQMRSNCNPDEVKFQGAAEDGDTNLMQELWDTGNVNCDAECEEHEKALVQATRANQIDAVELIFELRSKTILHSHYDKMDVEAITSYHEAQRKMIASPSDVQARFRGERARRVWHRNTRVREGRSTTATGNVWIVSPTEITGEGDIDLSGLALDNSSSSTAPTASDAPPDNNPTTVNVTVSPPNNVQHNNNYQTVNVTVPPSNNNFNANATANPVFQAPQPEGTDAEVECCASFLKCLKCVFPFLAAL